MRIIEPSRKRKSGFKAKLGQPSDQKHGSDGFIYTDKKNHENRASQKSKRNNVAEQLKSKSRNSETKIAPKVVAEPSAFSDGRKRRRSEYSDVSFFNDQLSSKKDADETEISKANEGEEKGNDGKTLEDFTELLASLDETKEEFNKLFSSGVRLLGMREHSVKEITDKLLAKTELSDVVYAVVDDLIDNKYLSNERFTESYVRVRMNRGFGPVKIKAELLNKGVSDSLIEEYLDPGAAVWFDNAKSEHVKKYHDEVIVDYRAWTKRARFLQSRGFNMDQIHSAIAMPG